MTAANSVALGADSVANRGPVPSYNIEFMNAQRSAGEVSVGSPGQERQITNVAPGLAPTDAVNVAQFSAGVNRMRQAIASSAALAGLVSNPNATGENQIAIGIGSFEGAGSVALGYIRHIGPNIMLRAAIAVNGTGSNRVLSNISASFGW